MVNIKTYDDLLAISRLFELFNKVQDDLSVYALCIAGGRGRIVQLDKDGTVARFNYEILE